MSSQADRRPVAGLLGREEGQILPLVALAMVVLIGFAGLVIDIGRVWVAQRQLQNAVDASAIAAVQKLPSSQDAQSNAIAYSGLNTGGTVGMNALSGYGVTASQDPTLTFKCLSTTGAPCSTSTDAGDTQCGPSTPGCNAVSVREEASVKTTFAGLFLPSFTVSATATASRGGGAASPLDIAVVVDSTASMNSSCEDSVVGISGTATKIDCAKEGVRTLLSGLWPCASNLQSCGTAAPVDEVTLLTFPALKNPAATNHDSNGKLTDSDLEMLCGGQYQGSAPSWYKPGGTRFPNWYIQSSDITYDAHPSYVITPLSNDFKTSDTSSLNPASPLVDAVSWDTCPNALYPGSEYYGLNSPGGVSTYYADAVSAAQAELATDSARGAQPVIILLSDGDANTKSPGQCTRAVQAAQSAATAGTWVYSVMYGQTSTNGGCSRDGKYSAYTAMQAIASDPSKFFCDPQPAGASCQAASSLNDIFQHIALDLSQARLIPDNTQ